MAFGSLIPWKNDKKNLPVHREQSDPFTALQQQMNRIFDEFHRGFDIEPFGGEMGGWMPAVNVSENDKEIRVEAELPGMEEKNIDVSLSDEALTIKGEKSEEKEEKDKNYHRIERSFGSFHRTIPLPAQIDADKVDAKFKNGVLTVVLPKSREAQQQVKKIQVKS